MVTYVKSPQDVKTQLCVCETFLHLHGSQRTVNICCSHSCSSCTNHFHNRSHTPISPSDFSSLAAVCLPPELPSLLPVYTNVCVCVYSIRIFLLSNRYRSHQGPAPAFRGLLSKSKLAQQVPKTRSRDWQPALKELPNTCSIHYKKNKHTCENNVCCN